MAAFQLGWYGIQTPHAPDFVFEQTAQSAYYLIMCFSTPFFADTALGREVGMPGDCLIVPPGCVHRHGTPPGEAQGFRNDWAYVAGEQVGAWLDVYQLPLNRRIATNYSELITPMLREIQLESLRHELYWERAVAQQIETLLRRIARASCAGHGLPLSPTEREYQKRLYAIRQQVHQHLHHPWAVKEMAELANLSATRFAAYYQRFFTVSPIEDLLRHRVEHAKELLLYSDATITQIAEQCGFHSVYYFSRHFRARMGCSPSVFRKSQMIAEKPSSPTIHTFPGMAIDRHHIASL